MVSAAAALRRSAASRRPSVRATCAPPRTQRCCCARNAAIDDGSSVATATSGTCTPRQPRSSARYDRSRSSVTDAAPSGPSQPPASSSAARRHIPPVPLNESGRASADSRACSTTMSPSRISACTRSSSERSFCQLQRACANPTRSPAASAPASRVRKSRGGTLSASSTAIHSPRALVSPCARLPAL